MICPNCSATVADGVSFCEFCGTPLQPAAAAQAAAEPQPEPVQAEPQAAQQPAGQQYQQPQYGQPAAAPAAVPADSKSKVAAGILAILLGSLGIHKFYLGYTQAGLIMLLVTVVGSLFTFGLAAAVIAVIALVEGILYLTKTDQDFYTTYVVGQKQWF